MVAPWRRKSARGLPHLGGMAQTCTLGYHFIVGISLMSLHHLFILADSIFSQQKKEDFTSKSE
jgi:hypothetical protein